MRAVTERWARIGPKNPSWLIHTPYAGLCLSVFIVARKDGSILLGRPRLHDAWPRKGGFPKGHAAQIEKEGAWLLPATHLLMEESPDHAAGRIVHEWAGLRGTPHFSMVQSHLRPHPPGSQQHWDICFIYELTAHHSPSSRPWWSEMRFLPTAKIREMKLARGHRDILEEAGYI
jgi:ADP-ribose pyrophosphatase YjhB (NUDIX family)